MLATIVVTSAPAMASFPGDPGDIYLVESDGTTASVIRYSGFTRIGPVVDCVVPGSRISTSGDGESMVYACVEDGDSEIYLSHLDGSTPTKLTDNAVVDNDPAISQDGTMLVFTSERDGDPELYVMTISSGETTRLTNSPGDDSDPVWAQTGAGCYPGSIYFVSDRDGDYEIYNVLPDGQGFRQLTSNTVADLGPDTNANGCGLAWSMEIDGVQQIVYDSPGQERDPFILTHSADNSFDPVWDAQRRWFAFSRQAVEPGSPIRAFTFRLAYIVELPIPDQTPGLDYTQAEWATERVGQGNNVHARSVTLRLSKHLTASGEITVPDGTSLCAIGWVVRIQKKTSSGWNTVSQPFTDTLVSKGVASYKGSIPDKPGTYRASVTNSPASWGGDLFCGPDPSPKKVHSH